MPRIGMEPFAKYSIQTYNDQNKKSVALHGAFNALVDASSLTGMRLMGPRLQICGAAHTYSFKGSFI